jgi:dihydrofolate reductase
MNELLVELFALLEKDTPGLNLGAFKLDTKKGVILTKIGEKTYEFTPNSKNVAELFNSVTGVAKHSPGRALVYLKQHAKGTPVTESLDDDPYVPTKGHTVRVGAVKGKIVDVDLPAPDENKIIIRLENGKELKVEGDKVKFVSESLVVEDAKDLVRYDEMSKFEDALAAVAKKKKAKGFDVTLIGGVNVYSIKGQFFAALDRRHDVGIIDPDFEGDGQALADELKKHLKESLVVEHRADVSTYSDEKKFDDAIKATKIWLKMPDHEVSKVGGVDLYHKRSKYFAAWDPEKKKGIIDPDFKDKAPELLDQLKKVTMH